MSKNFSNIEQNFHHSIQRGKLSVAADILLNELVDEDIFIALLIIKMQLSIIERYSMLGRIGSLENELRLKTGIALQLLRIYKEIQN